MPTFTLIVPPLVAVQTPQQNIIGGADISLNGDFTTTPAGDWGLVSGVAAAYQSVVREAGASPGDFPRRPGWGVGLAALVHKGASKAVRDRATSALSARTRANRRIRSVISCTSQQNKDGITLTIQAEAVDGPMKAVIPTKGLK